MTAAASQGHIEVMRVLCQHGASIHNSSDTPWAGHWSETPLEAAVNHQKAEAVVWLLEQGARPNDGLAQAASRGDVSTLQLLVRHEANVEAHGTRALHQAIDVGRASTAELLLELGAPSYLEAFCRKLCFCDVGTLLEWLSDSLDFVSSQDLRALHSTAVKYGHTEFARMLAAADRRLA
jgi:ankyrin repeat protein